MCLKLLYAQLMCGTHRRQPQWWKNVMILVGKSEHHVCSVCCDSVVHCEVQPRWNNSNICFFMWWIPVGMAAQCQCRMHNLPRRFSTMWTDTKSNIYWWIQMMSQKNFSNAPLSFKLLLPFCSSSPLLLLKAAVAPGLRPFAFLPRLGPLLGPSWARGGSTSSSLGPRSWSRSGSTGYTVTALPPSRWISILLVIIKGRKGTQSMKPRQASLEGFWTDKQADFHFIHRGEK